MTHHKKKKPHNCITGFERTSLSSSGEKRPTSTKVEGRLSKALFRLVVSMLLSYWLFVISVLAVLAQSAFCVCMLLSYWLFVISVLVVLAQSAFCFRGSRSLFTWWRKACLFETGWVVFFFLWCVKRYFYICLYINQQFLHLLVILLLNSFLLVRSWIWVVIFLKQINLTFSMWTSTGFVRKVEKSFFANHFREC